MSQKKVTGKVHPLPPSRREKKRYVAFEVVNPKEGISAEQAFLEIQMQMRSLTGSKGLAQAGLMLLKNKSSLKKRRGLIRVSNRHVDNLRASIALADGSDMVLQSIGTSGMLKKAYHNYIA